MIDSFWGEHGFLSNFSPHAVVYEGDIYPTAEHAFQAAKTLDPAQRAQIRSAGSPGAAKGLGRRVALRPFWNEVRVEIMRQILASKFAPGSAVAGLLLETGNEELIEGNTWGDTFWGVCGGEGENHLGRLLMELREELRRAA